MLTLTKPGLATIVVIAAAASASSTAYARPNVTFPSALATSGQGQVALAPPTSTPVGSSEAGFQWDDAGIGAAGALGVIGLLGAARRRVTLRT